MWIPKEIKIEGKKVNAQVNESNSSIEIELPYDSKFCKITSIEIDGTNHKISNGIINIGDREEILMITINKEQTNERKSPQSRENTKLSK